jgi:hypothetical protein
VLVYRDRIIPASRAIAVRKRRLKEINSKLSAPKDNARRQGSWLLLSFVEGTSMQATRLHT